MAFQSKIPFNKPFVCIISSFNLISPHLFSRLSKEVKRQNIISRVGKPIARKENKIPPQRENKCGEIKLKLEIIRFIKLLTENIGDEFL